MLVVEHDAAVRMLVVEASKDAGFRVLEAHDGPSGLQALMSVPDVPLMVTDDGLPGMDGQHLAAAARQRRPDLKILYIGGHPSNAAMGYGAALPPGMALISRPFALASLVTKLQAMIEG